jgi:hypothetical protein
MNLPFIIVIKEGILDSAEVSTPDKCTKHFLDKCAECLSNWDDYDADDVRCVLDDGYAEFGGNGSSVCLTWIDEIPEKMEAPQIFVDKNGAASIV